MRVGLIILLVTTTVLVVQQPPVIRPVNAITQTEVWSANFETGNNSQFNGLFNNTCLGGIIGVSTTIVHSGHYSGFYSGQSNATSGKPSCAEYPIVDLNVKPYSKFQPITSFHFKMWVYIPRITQKSWFSFATFGTGDFKPFTIDCNVHGQIQLFVSDVGRIIHQNSGSSARRVPFNRWFSISLYAYNLGTRNANVTIYQDGTQIIQYQGSLLNGPLTFAHFGLYMSNDQPSLVIYNDDLVLWKIT